MTKTIMQYEQLNKEINDYWTNRATGYSDVNQSELQGIQHQGWQKLINEAIENHFAGKTRGKINVLDVGAGPGFFSIILAELGYKVTAFDANEKMLAQAKQNAGLLKECITFVQGDAQAMPFSGESFDIVVSRNLTWVLPKPDLAYKEWCRVLKPRGLLINFDANWYNYLYDEDKKKSYTEDRENVAKQGYEDHYLTTDINAMEKIALQVPLSPIVRPAWDIEVLSNCGIKSIKVNTDINNRVLSEVEKLNYASSPYFMITAVKL